VCPRTANPGCARPSRSLTWIPLRRHCSWRRSGPRRSKPLTAFTALEREHEALDRQWQLRIERARYEAQRAQRQDDAIEPENRPVARTLETRWNTALQALEQLERMFPCLGGGAFPLGGLNSFNFSSLWEALLSGYGCRG
jgi:hypothetical protein